MGVDAFEELDEDELEFEEGSPVEDAKEDPYGGGAPEAEAEPDAADASFIVAAVPATSSRSAPRDRRPPPPKPLTSSDVKRNLWQVHPSPYGAPYYHNAATGESRWTLPTGLFDVILPPSEAQDPSEATTTQGGEDERKENETEKEKARAQAQAQGQAPAPTQAKLQQEKKPKASAKQNAKAKAKSGTASSSGSSDSSGDSSSSAAKPPSRLEAFVAMLKEKKVGAFDRYELWLPRLLHDSRFTAIPVTDRRALFTQQVRLLTQQRRANEGSARVEASKNFRKFLVENSSARQILEEGETVAEVISKLSKSEASQDQRWRKVSPSDRERILTQVLKERWKQSAAEASKAAVAFRAMLKESLLDPSRTDFSASGAPDFGEARKELREDSRWKAVANPAERRRLYLEAASEVTRREQAKRKVSAEAEEDLAWKRQRSRRDETEKNFRDLLANTVKAPLELTWAQAQFLLGDAALRSCGLDQVSQEMLFDEFCAEDGARRLNSFEEALASLPASSLETEREFEQAKAAAAARIPGGEAKLSGLPEQKLRRSWEDWRRLRLLEASEVFETWLQSCEFIHQAASDESTLSGAGPAFEALCTKLSTDLRYTRLDLLPRERTQLIIDRLQEARQEQQTSRAERVAATETSDDEGEDEGQGSKGAEAKLQRRA